MLADGVGHATAMYLFLGVICGVWAAAEMLTLVVRASVATAFEALIIVFFSFALTMFMWPWMVKMMYDDDNGDWRG